MNQDLEQELLNSWMERQEYAELMQPLVGKLYREQSVEITVFGRSLVGSSAIDIIKAHRSVRLHKGTKLRLRESHPLLVAISQLELPPLEIDLGKLAYHFQYENESGQALDAYLQDTFKDVPGKVDTREPVDIILYGFGRIGRLLARLLIERQGKNNSLRLRAIVTRGGKEGDLEKRASLLRRDSIHGPFNGSITVNPERSAIKANGAFIQMIYANSPDEVDYTQYGVLGIFPRNGTKTRNTLLI